MNDIRSNFFTNNFNLIRLLAALQVTHYHFIAIYNIDVSVYYKHLVAFFGFFPGVPIFFFISGFLVSRSWETSKSWKSYTLKRFARIEPALLASVIFTLILIISSGYIGTLSDTPSIFEYTKLILAKSTIFQSYNPEYLRQYGDGAFNGSLWTITVELQFYAAIPIIYFITRKFGSLKTLILLLITAAGIGYAFSQIDSSHLTSIYYKLVKISLIPWVYMFITGIIFQKYFSFFYTLLRGKFIYCMTIYLFLCALGLNVGADFGNTFNPILFLSLASVIFSAAYTAPELSIKTIGDYDISYGVYLYHMPLINFFIFMSYESTAINTLILSLLIITISILSWVYLEKPCLSAAKKHLRQE